MVRTETDSTKLGRMPPSQSRRVSIFAARGAAGPAAVGLVLLVAFLVRSWGIPAATLLYYDEGWAARDGRLLIAGMTRLAGWGSIFQHAVYNGGDWKLGHDLLLGGLLTAGVPPDGLPWMAVAAGAVLMLAVAAVAWAHWGAPAGAVAGVFAGTLPLSIYYGHHVLAEADGLAGLAVAVLLWDRFWRRPESLPRALAPMLAGVLTASLNYRFIPVVAPLIGTVAWRYIAGVAGGRRWVRRIAAVSLVPAAVVIVTYATISIAAGLFHGDAPSWLLKFLRTGGESPVPFRFPDFYLRTMWEFGGAVFAAALVLGVLAIIRFPGTDQDLMTLAAGSIIGTLLVFTAVSDKAPRVLVAAIPFAALIAARGMTLWRGRGWQWAAAAIACTACTLSGWAGSSAAREPGGISAAAHWLAAQSGAVVADRPPTVELYLRQDRWDTGVPDHSRPIFHPPEFASLAAMKLAGVRWVVIDANTWILPSSGVSRKLAGCLDPIAEFDDRASWTRLWFLDGADTRHLGYDGMIALRQSLLADAGGRMTIRVYDLDRPGAFACG